MDKIIVVAVKFNDFDKTLLKHAVKLAKEDNLKILLVHVHHSLHLNSDLDNFMFNRDNVKSIEEQKIEKLEELMKVESYTKVQHELVIALSVSEALKTVIEPKYDVIMIICGSHRKHKVPQILINSTASQIVHQVKSNVTVLKYD